MHALIVGPRQVGKSTLIRRVLEEIKRPVWGFVTRKEDELADKEHGSPVYIYDADGPQMQTPDNLVGYCGDGFRLDIYTKTFDRFATRLENRPDSDSIILMDELGFMESQSEAFCGAVLSILDGEIPVIAAVKHNDVPFLDAVRTHPDCRCFYITEENRDALFGEVLAFVQAQLCKI